LHGDGLQAHPLHGPDDAPGLPGQSRAARLGTGALATIALAFLALYDATYGPGTYYLADSFNEMRPPVADDGSGGGNGGFGDGGAAKGAAALQIDPALKARRLAAYGKAIHAAFHQARPDAVWVMQGWLFGADPQFWDLGPAWVATWGTRPA